MTPKKWKFIGSPLKMVLFLNISTVHQHRGLNLFSFSCNSFLLCEAHIFSKNVWCKQETYFIICSETVLALFSHCNMCWIFKRISKWEKKLRKGFDQNLFNTYCSHTQTSSHFFWVLWRTEWCEEHIEINESFSMIFLKDCWFYSLNQG